MQNKLLPRLIETERTIIRPVQPGDGQLIYDALVESYEQFRLWLLWVDSHLSAPACEESCCSAYQKFLKNEYFRALIVHKQDNSLIGCIDLHNINWELGQFEVGYWCRTSRQGNGFITEAVRTLVEYTMKNYAANRVSLTTDERNISSQKVAEKSGFIYEGTLHLDRPDNEGKLRDTKVYAIWHSGSGS